jgi:hypothetical protein
MDGEDRRLRLRRLDDCLDVLEQAHELNLTEVSERMAEALGERVPTVHPGMLIADAIEEVSRRVRRRRDPFDVRLLLQRR